MNKLKENKGITLIALVITIIVLLILAGITIALITGQDSAPDKAAEARTENTKGAAKDAATMLVAEKIQDYYEGKYVNNDTTAKGASDILDYLEIVLSSTNAVTRDGYVIVVADGTITATKTGESTAFVSGTVSSEGVISWNGTTDGGTQTADVDPYNGLATEADVIPQLFTYQITSTTTGKVEGVDEVGKVADIEGTIKLADETTTRTAKITGLDSDYLASLVGINLNANRETWPGSMENDPLLSIGEKFVIPYKVKLDSNGKYSENGEIYYIKEIGSLVGNTNSNVTYVIKGVETNSTIGSQQKINIILPEGIETIGSDAFEFVGLFAGQASINIPSTVTSIGSHAFSGCRVDSINIPKSVTNIGDGAIENIYANTIYLDWTEDEWNEWSGSCSLGNTPNRVFATTSSN